MKKFICFLTAAIMLVSLWSCSESAKETEPASSANSASGEFILTREMISKMLKETQTNASSTKNSLSAGEQAVPDFMSLEKVQALVKEKDYSFAKALFEYEDTVEQKFEALIAELPERCIIYQHPAWVINAEREVRRYIVLDPENVPMDTTELGLYLEWEYYEARYGKDYDGYYDVDMTALEEKYADIGTVLIDRWGTWFYLDPKANTLEIIEFFPDHEAIVRESYKAFDAQMDSFTADLNK